MPRDDGRDARRPSVGEPGPTLKPLLTWLKSNVRLLSMGAGIAFAFVAYLALLALLHFVALTNWLPSANGLPVDKLGPLGDSFGPLTSMFAAIAALGAWRSYATQKQLLTDERNRHRGTRFDETFFRLIDHYDREVARLVVNVPPGKDTFIDAGTYKGIDAVGAFKRTVKIFQFGDERFGADVDAFTWGLTNKRFKQLILLRDQQIAITRWLKRVSKNVRVDLRGALLVGKLSDDELWFWYFSIVCTGDQELEEFASKLGIQRKRAIDAGKLNAPEIQPPEP